MVLTPEEIQRIDEEERVRAEAHAKYAQPQAVTQAESAKPKKKTPFIAKVFLVIFIIFVVLIIVGATGGGSQPATSTYPINVAVKYSSTEVEVTNNDAFAWTSCELILNLSSTNYYHVNITGIPSLQSKSYLLNDFIENAGTKRFNPLAESIGNFSVSCDTPNGRGFWSVGPKL